MNALCRASAAAVVALCSALLADSPSAAQQPGKVYRYDWTYASTSNGHADRTHRYTVWLAGIDKERWEDLDDPEHPVTIANGPDKWVAYPRLSVYTHGTAEIPTNALMYLGFELTDPMWKWAQGPRRERLGRDACDVYRVVGTGKEMVSSSTLWVLPGPEKRTRRVAHTSRLGLVESSTTTDYTRWKVYPRVDERLFRPPAGYREVPVAEAPPSWVPGVPRPAAARRPPPSVDVWR